MMNRLSQVILTGMPDMQKVENSLSKAREIMAMDQFAKRTKGLVLLKISKGILRDIFKLNVDR